MLYFFQDFISVIYENGLSAYLVVPRLKGRYFIDFIESGACCLMAYIQKKRLFNGLYLIMGLGGLFSFD